MTPIQYFFQQSIKMKKGSMIPWTSRCLRAVGGTLCVSTYFTTQLFQFGTPYFRIFIACLVLESTLFPGAHKTIRYGVLFLRGPGQKEPDQPYCHFLHVFFWDAESLLIYFNQALFRIGSVGRGGNGGGGSGRDSINIYIQCVKINKGIFCYSWLQEKFLLALLKIVWD